MPITTEACAGPCNRAARDAWDAYDQAVTAHDIAVEKWLALTDDDRGPIPEQPEQPTAPVALGVPTWCPRCPRIIRAALAELDDTAALLNATVDGHRGAAMAGPTGMKPLDHKAIIDSLDELYGALTEVEDQWREHRGYPDRPRRARGSHARTLTIGWLLGELDDILLHPGSVAFGLGVLAWHRRLLKMSKSDPATRRSPIACPRCRERQVSRADDYYECGSCGRLLSQREYDDEYARQADEHAREEVPAS